LKNDFNDKQNSYIKREQELQQTVKKLHNQLDAVRDKELKYDSYILKFDQLERNNADLRATIDEKERVIKRLSTDTHNIDHRFNNLNTEIEVLKKDKQFLTDKNNGLINEIRTVKDEIITRDDKITDLKNTKKKLKQDLNQLSEVSKNKNVDELLRNELEKLRVKTDDEVKNQKKYMQEMHSSEVKILKEQVESLKDANDKYEGRIRSKERQYDEVMSE
jgi:chromosome segregation ATPase